MKTTILDKLRCIMQWCAAGTVVVLFATDRFPQDANFYKVLALMLILAGNVLFGKLFCSHLCPLGLIQEQIVKLRKKISPNDHAKLTFTPERWGIADKTLRMLKYIILLLLFADFNTPITIFSISVAAIAIFAGNMLLCKYLCPINAFSNICRYTVIFAVFLLLNALLECCDIDIPSWILVLAASAVCYIREITVHKSDYNISMLHIHKDHSKCSRCTNCSKTCPFGIDFRGVKRVNDIDCNLCGECVKVCGEDAVKVGICNTRPGQNRIRGIWFAPLITVVLLAIALYLIYS